jgi:hypothetical protein
LSQDFGAGLKNATQFFHARLFGSVQKVYNGGEVLANMAKTSERKRAYDKAYFQRPYVRAWYRAYQRRYMRWWRVKQRRHKWDAWRYPSREALEEAVMRAIKARKYPLFFPAERMSELELEYEYLEALKQRWGEKITIKNFTWKFVA